MVGHCTDRFEQLADNQRLKQELLCGICREVIADAIQTQCLGKHNFCYDCLTLWLLSGTDTKVCPECRQSLTTRNSGQLLPNHSVIELVPGVWVERNRTLNNIIQGLNTRCDYHWNGCQVSMPLDTIDGHIAECSKRLCQTCDQQLVVGLTRDEHCCVDALKSAVVEMTGRYQQLTTDKSQLQQRFSAHKKVLEQRLKQSVINFKRLKTTDMKYNQVVACCQSFYRKFQEKRRQLNDMESQLRSLLPTETSGNLTTTVDDINCCLICDQTLGNRPLIACSNTICSTKFHMTCLGLDHRPDDFKCPNCYTQVSATTTIPNTAINQLITSQSNRGQPPPPSATRPLAATTTTAFRLTGPQTARRSIGPIGIAYINRYQSQRSPTRTRQMARRSTGPRIYRYP